MKFKPRLVVGESSTPSVKCSTYKLGDYMLGENFITKITCIEENLIILVNICDKGHHKGFTPEELKETPWRKINKTRIVELLYV